MLLWQFDFIIREQIALILVTLHLANIKILRTVAKWDTKSFAKLSKISVKLWASIVRNLETIDNIRPFVTCSHSMLQMCQLHDRQCRSVGRQQTRHRSGRSVIPSLTSSAGAYRIASSNRMIVFAGISEAATKYLPKSFDQSVCIFAMRN